MGIYRPVAASVQSDITLHRWCIREVTAIWRTGQDPDTSRHVVGSAGDGRVSSPIVGFDKDTMIVTSVSGRKYHLSGDSGYSMDSEYVFSEWLNMFSKLIEVTDVTSEYEPS